MKGCKLLSIVLLAVFAMAGVLAAFQYSGNSINEQYLMGERIKGKINISFSNHPANSILRSNFEGNISLKDFLDRNNAAYECLPTTDCLPGYTTVGGPINQIMINGEEVVGFKVTGPDVSIQSVSLKAVGSTEPQCSNQLTIDILDNNEKFLINPSYNNETCFIENYGCFNGNLESGYEEAIIGTIPYCNKVSLEVAPAFKIGAIVKDKTSGTGNLEMQLFTLGGSFLKKCTLPPHTQNTQKLECIIEYSTYSSGEYLACIKAENSGTNYKIRSETSNPVCGTANPYSYNEFTIDFEAFTQPLKFGGVEIEVGELFNEVYQQSLGSYADDYIQDRYNGECSQGCIIPLKFTGENQNINLENIMITYYRSNALLTNEELFNLNLRQPEVTSGDLSLELLHAGFTIPFYGNESLFTVFLDETQVFSKPVNISQSFDFEMEPNFVSFGQTARFKAITPFNITNSVWIFGDNSTKTVQGKEVEHTYLQQGVLKLEVKLTRADGVIAIKKFDIVVGDPREIANQTINNYKKRLLDLSNDIDSFPEWVRESINPLLNITEMNMLLSIKESQYNSAVTDEDFQNVMLGLLSLRIPIGVEVSKKLVVPAILGYEGFDTSYLRSLSPQNDYDEDDLKSAITSWMAENFDSKIDLEVISALYDENSESLITNFKIETKPKKNVQENSSLIIAINKNNIKFRRDYSAQSSGSGTYIPISPGQTNQVFEFVLLDEVGFLDLGAYISPSIENLGIAPNVAICNYNKICEPWKSESRTNCPADCRPWKWFTFWISLIFIGGLIIYVLMQEWYKRHYEKSLFPNENDLYNLINFIYNSRKIGLANRQIRKKLSETGWKSEKIKYALKKIDGKRTGMYEIPIFKVFENRKVKKEIEKRQVEPIDARFIKRKDLSREDVKNI